MPDAQLSKSNSPSPLVSALADRSLLSSKKSSPETAAVRGVKIPLSLSVHRRSQIPSRQTPSLGNSTSPPARPSSLPYFGRPVSLDMPGAIVDVARPPKVSSSTNNLFSSSCQPMRNTPNGESFAKVASFFLNTDHLGLY
jgi:hypothetical protein